MQNLPVFNDIPATYRKKRIQLLTEFDYDRLQLLMI
ncbi:hypothetical protein SBA3_3000007 [Candidatus Sulfopaludibacter sp. SbA3]|nr:hypothetical protein SBA3_3000007 [Candidatus Sulfopaludibacter sp. SbA3]